MYYEHIQKLVHGLQTLSIDSFFTTMFWQDYNPI
jgi:hypothetical protein